MPVEIQKILEYYVSDLVRSLRILDFRNPFNKGKPTKTECEEFDELLKNQQSVAGIAKINCPNYSYTKLLSLDPKTGNTANSGEKIPRFNDREQTITTDKAGEIYSLLASYLKKRKLEWFRGEYDNSPVRLLLLCLIKEVNAISSISTTIDDIYDRTRLLSMFCQRLCDSNNSEILKGEVKNGKETLYNMLEKVSIRAEKLASDIGFELRKRSVRDHLNNWCSERIKLRNDFLGFIFHIMSESKSRIGGSGVSSMVTTITDKSFLIHSEENVELFDMRRYVLFKKILSRNDADKKGMDSKYGTRVVPEESILKLDDKKEIVTSQYWIDALSQKNLGKEAEDKDFVNSSTGFPKEILEHAHGKVLIKLFVEINGLMEVFDKYEEDVKAIQAAACFGGDNLLYSSLPVFVNNTFKGAEALDSKILKKMKEIIDILNQDSILTDKAHGFSNYAKHNSAAICSYDSFSEQRTVCAIHMREVIKFVEQSEGKFVSNKVNIFRNILTSFEKQRDSSNFMNYLLDLKGKNRIKCSAGELEFLQKNLNCSERKLGKIKDFQDHKYEEDGDACKSELGNYVVEEEENSFVGDADSKQDELKDEELRLIPEITNPTSIDTYFLDNVSELLDNTVTFFGAAKVTEVTSDYKYTIINNAPHEDSWFRRGKSTQFNYLKHISHNKENWSEIIGAIERYESLVSISNSALIKSCELQGMKDVSWKIQKEIKYINSLIKSLYFWSGETKKKMRCWISIFVLLKKEVDRIRRSAKGCERPSLWLDADNALMSCSYSLFHTKIENLVGRGDKTATLVQSLLDGKKELTEKLCSNLLSHAGEDRSSVLGSAAFAVVCTKGDDTLVEEALKYLLGKDEVLVKYYAKRQPHLARRLAKYYLNIHLTKEAAKFFGIAIEFSDTESKNEYSEEVLSILDEKDLYKLGIKQIKENGELALKCFAKTASSKDSKISHNSKLKIASIILSNENMDKTKVKEVLYNFEPCDLEEYKEEIQDEGRINNAKRCLKLLNEEGARKYIAEVKDWSKTKYHNIIYADDLLYDIEPGCSTLSQVDSNLLRLIFLSAGKSLGKKELLRLFKRLPCNHHKEWEVRRKAVELGAPSVVKDVLNCVPYSLVIELLGNTIEEKNVEGQDANNLVAKLFFKHVFPKEDGNTRSISNNEARYIIAKYYSKKYKRNVTLVKKLRGILLNIKIIDVNFKSILENDVSKETEFLLKILACSHKFVMEMLFKAYTLGDKGLQKNRKKAILYFKRSFTSSICGSGVKAEVLYNVKAIRLYHHLNNSGDLTNEINKYLSGTAGVRFLIRNPIDSDKELLSKYIKVKLEGKAFCDLKYLIGRIDEDGVVMHESLREDAQDAYVKLVIEMQNLSGDEENKLYEFYTKKFSRKNNNGGGYAPICRREIKRVRMRNHTLEGITSDEEEKILNGVTCEPKSSELVMPSLLASSQHKFQGVDGRIGINVQAESNIVGVGY